MRKDGSFATGASGDGDIVSFVGRVRRRGIAASLLYGALFAVLLNEVVRWGSIIAIRWTRWEIPVLDVGPFYLLILLYFLNRRSSLAAAARRADSRIGFCDRLTSFLDFRTRADVPSEIRRAQAGETARALAHTSVAAAAPLPRWLAAGPALLFVSLAYPYFLFMETETLTMRLTRQLVTGRNLTPGGERVAPDPSGEEVVDAAPTPGRNQASPSQEGQRASDSSGAAGPAVPNQPPGPVPGTPASGQPPAAGEPPRNHLDGVEPGRLTSQRIGTGLARLVDPLYNPGDLTPPAPPTPAGTFSFHLLPRSAQGNRGPGAARGETVDPERITVDLDTLPEQYRALVRSYFEQLAMRREPPPLDNENR